MTEKPHYKGRGKLAVAMRKRLTTAARCAIKMRSTESDAKRATELLRRDLINGPRHCFGIHSDCSTDYCKAVRSAQVPPTSGTVEASISGTVEASTSVTVEASTPGTAEEPESLGTVASKEGQFWRDATDEGKLEAVRSVAPQLPANVDPELTRDIQRIVGRSTRPRTPTPTGTPARLHLASLSLLCYLTSPISLPQRTCRCHVSEYCLCVVSVMTWRGRGRPVI